MSLFQTQSILTWATGSWQKKKSLERAWLPEKTDIFLTPYKNFSIQVVKVDLGTAPITASFFSPPLKIITVGILRIPYRVAMEGLSSVLTLKHLSFPAYCFDSSSIMGKIIRQGPHHGAQNSTRTGNLQSSTRDCHVSSLTDGTAGFKNKQKDINISWNNSSQYNDKATSIKIESTKTRMSINH